MPFRPLDVSQPYNAAFGVNRFLVTYPAIVAEQFPSHVTSVTAVGRLANVDRLINVDVELHHDDKVTQRLVSESRCWTTIAMVTYSTLPFLVLPARWLRGVVRSSGRWVVHASAVGICVFRCNCATKFAAASGRR